LSPRGSQRPRRRRRGPRRTSTLAVVAITLALIGAAPAAAGQSATLSAAFKPERLGAATSVTFAFQIKSQNGVPPALNAVSIHYPAGLGLTTSGLGVASCQASRLEAAGPDGCPADSRMGNGDAQLRFAIGPQIFQESATLALIAAPSPDGYLHMLIAATGTQPVAARVVMSTLLDAGQLQISVPAVPSLPEGPAVAIVSVQATLGGALDYHEREGGHTVSYRPRGIGLPAHCPPGGFRFSAQFSFADASHASASTTVSCPRRR
jgi:hypothetical protein